MYRFDLAAELVEPFIIRQRHGPSGHIVHLDILHCTYSMPSQAQVEMHRLLYWYSRLW